MSAPYDHSSQNCVLAEGSEHAATSRRPRMRKAPNRSRGRRLSLSPIIIFYEGAFLLCRRRRRRTLCRPRRSRRFVDEFHIQLDPNLISHHGRIKGHPVVSSADRGRGRNATMRSAPRVLHRRSGAIDVENNFLGDSMHGQIACHLQLARTSSLHPFRLEGDRRILGDIEEVVTPQIFISHFHSGIHGTGVDGHVDRSFAAIGRIINDHAADFGEGSPDSRDPQVANGKLCCRMRRVEIPGLGLCHGAKNGQVSQPKKSAQLNRCNNVVFSSHDGRLSHSL